ncbi:serine/threonine-protein phosphatase [Desulfobaculum bizertense]|uniref:PP2C family protein-serine/threonine phosphatase n=1 Tax=Desulfobaculum bizertense TaxID=376490 RepID=UPI001F17E7D6|nr:PP2C family serine/threonine-protein phosphatase [Desulfobaculum bizertense]UIJ38979.1 serine/threonine-protein phosphatase [Desulfobaculum bizertense]
MPEYSCSFFSISKKKNLKNQDSILAPLRINEQIIFAVADGVGGHPGGEIASQFATSSLQNLYFNNQHLSLRAALTNIQFKMKTLVTELKAPPTMATTLTCCILNEKKFSLAHTGDSRCYRVRDTNWELLTKDQTELQELYDRKIFTKKQLKKYPNSKLSAALSPQLDVKAEFSKHDLIPNDIIVLMTDGVHKVLTPKTMPGPKASISTFSICEALKRRAQNAGPIDDYSAIALQFIE